MLCATGIINLISPDLKQVMISVWWAYSVFRTVQVPHRDGGDNNKRKGQTGPLAVVLCRANYSGDCWARFGSLDPTRQALVSIV